MEDSEPVDELSFNGVSGASGKYLLEPVGANLVSTLARGEKLDPQELAELKARFLASTEGFLGVVDGVDPLDLAEAGWGVIFTHDADPAILEALKPLLDHRKGQASAKNENFYRELTGVDGYRPGDTSSAYLVRHKAAPGEPANPEKLPYYLLIVGDPESIPYRFQYQLDVTYATGRIHFRTLEEYARYAQSVVAAEKGEIREKKTALFFGTQNPDDRATRMSSKMLVGPLAEKLSAKYEDWSIDTVVGEGATKAALTGAVTGQPAPTLLFTATHGVGFPIGDMRQLDHQGALLCQDWPGPLKGRGEIPETSYFGGHDITETANLSGMLAFLFACYGAGTPKTDDFSREALGEAADIAPHAFVARLPQRLLLQGALAVVGHVERAWSYSFNWPRAGEQLDVFESCLSQVMRGVPVGHAVEYFNDKYAALTTELESERENLAFGGVPDPVGLSGLWTAKNDARNYAIVGDPAVRIA